MALRRWFLGASSTQMKGRSSCSEGNGGCTKGVRMVGRQEKKITWSRAVNGRRDDCSSGFQMPLHYPRYRKEDYEKMEEWKVDMVLNEYGLAVDGSLEEKRAYAIGAFLWPDQL